MLVILVLNLFDINRTKMAHNGFIFWWVRWCVYASDQLHHHHRGSWLCLGACEVWTYSGNEMQCHNMRYESALTVCVITLLMGGCNRHIITAALFHFSVAKYPNVVITFISGITELGGRSSTNIITVQSNLKPLINSLLFSVCLSIMLSSAQETLLSTQQFSH